MSKFTDRLLSDLVREHATTLAQVDRPSRRVRVARPRVLAGGSLGVAGVVVGLVAALGGSAATPAFAVTRDADGAVVVHVNVDQSTQPWAEGADRELAAQGINESIDGIETAPGPATSSSPVSCTPGGGALMIMSGGVSRPPAMPSGPQVKVLLGSSGTGIIPSGTTGAGTVHLVSCDYYENPPAGGNTGS